MDEKKEIKLKPCPFCGGAAEIIDTHVYLDKAVRIRCTGCSAVTRRILIDHPRLDATLGGLDESTRYTRDQAIEKAAEAWNGRAGRKQSEGEWIFCQGVHYYEADTYRCSRCRVTVRSDEVSKARFCLNCGAKMKGESNV